MAELYHIGERGVLQGLPSSCSLFNIVMDGVTAKLDVDLGVDALGTDGKAIRGKGVVQGKIPCLHFADDTILISNTPEAHQAQLNRFVSALAHVGRKSRLLSLVHKRGKWLSTTDMAVMADQQRIPAMLYTETCKYLGVWFGAAGLSDGNAKEVLMEGLVEIEASELNAGQQGWALRKNLIPKLIHCLVLCHKVRGGLNVLDKNIRRFVSAWCNFPAEAPWSIFHARVKDGGLEIPQLRAVTPFLQKRRLELLQRSDDPVVSKVVKGALFTRLLEKASRLFKM